MDNEHLERFEEALQRWTDERFVSRADIRTVSMFTGYIVNLAEDDGWAFCGYSLRAGSPMSLLVVKGAIEGVRHVVFTSARTTTGCMRIFLRKMEEGLLEWTPDKFA